jgi:23S rRNA pseudouridine2605 synthase
VSENRPQPPIMSPSPFQKFTQKKKNSAIKEAFRQEKKKAKKERAAFFEEKKKKEFEERQTKRGQSLKTKSSATGIPSKVSKKSTDSAATIPLDDHMPLNKYIAHGGICSRRDAATLVKDGKVKVNGTICSEPGYKVKPGDQVICNGKKITPSRNLCYILLNKPKDYITTTDDPQGRKTVLQLIKHATDQRIYPVGRLDRNTSGVLLLTNDGDLTQKLCHPRFEISKIYEARLDKPLAKTDFEKILKGLVLEDGPVFVDSLAYADARDKSIIGIEIHSGKNRIVRRIFEHLKYDVKNLDRVMYAGLTKKNVERGRYRFLTEKEVRLLKYLNSSRTKKSGQS